MNASDLLDIISNPDLLPQRSRYYGVFYGYVEDNHDPLQLGRLRVRTPHYFGQPRDALPWASYSSPGGGGLSNNGFYFVPPVGSQVSVSYIGGDPEYPIWLGAVPGAPGGVSDTHVASLNPLRPYGKAVTGWDYTRFNSITTPSGHRIVLDDNKTAELNQNLRRILLESSSGNYIRIIESRESAPGVNRPLLEIATVDDSGTAVRRIALDNEDENITITGPDSFGFRNHQFEINSPEDYMQLISGRGYSLRIDDSRELIDLFTTRPGSIDVGHRLRFRSQDRWVEIKTSDDRFCLTSKDNESGHFGLFSPYGEEAANRRASIIIDRGPYGALGGDPVIMLTASEDVMGSNGVLVDPGLDGSRPQAVTIYGAGPSTDGLPTPQDVIQLVSKSKGSPNTDGSITIGKVSGTHTIRLIPLTGLVEVISTSTISLLAGATLAVQAPTVSIAGGIGSILSDSSGLKLHAMQITMEGPQVHNYFSHYHEVALVPSGLPTTNPLAATNAGKWVVLLAPGVYAPVIPNPNSQPTSNFLVSDFPKG